MKRTTTLALLVLISVGIVLPYGNSAHGLRQNTQIDRHHRYHSRAWWRRYRARLRAKRAAAMAHRNAMLALPQNISLSNLISDSSAVAARAFTAPAFTATAVTAPAVALPPVDVPAVTAPVPSANTNSMPLQPSSKGIVGLPGQINLAVVALSRPNPAFLTSREESKMLAGVNVSEFRRIVIDKMLNAGGWVTNDFVREVNGSRVFVVIARTPREANAPEKAWTFYFTEVGGRIYGLTIDAPVEYADQMTDEAERLINSLHSQNNK